MTTEQQTERPSFIFGKKVAEMMDAVPMYVQMESNMIATTLLLCGLIFIAIYQLFFLQINWIVKGAIIFNILCAIGIMAGNLVTSYQQYSNYIQTIGVDLKEMKKQLRAQRKAKRLRAKNHAPQETILNESNTSNSSLFTIPAETQNSQNIQDIQTTKDERRLN